MSEYHIPVMLNESISALLANPEGIYADATFGGGGHTAELLSRLHDGGRVIAFDRDIDALENALKDPRLTLIHNNFRFIENYATVLRKEGSLSGTFARTGSRSDVEEREPSFEAGIFDGILADLGVSSHQFDTAERGFSFRYEEAPLDMRMNEQASRTAADLVNTAGEEDLERILKLYGEVENKHFLELTDATGRPPTRRWPAFTKRSGLR